MRRGIHPRLRSLLLRFWYFSVLTAQVATTHVIQPILPCELPNGNLLRQCWAISAAGAKPDVVETPHVFEQPDQALATARPADQSVMQADRKQLWRTALALAIENIECIAHVGEKIFAGGEAAVFVEAVVVRLVRIRDDQMRPARRYFSQYGSSSASESRSYRNPPASTSSRRVFGPGRPVIHPIGRVPVSRVRISTARRICSRSTSSATRAIIDPAIAMADDLVTRDQRTPWPIRDFVPARERPQGCSS